MSRRSSLPWLMICSIVALWHGLGPHSVASQTTPAEQSASAEKNDARATRRGKPRVYPPRTEESAETPTPSSPATPPTETKPPKASQPKPAEKAPEAKIIEEKTPEKTDVLSAFLRVQRDKEGVPQSLDTSVVRYVPAEGKGDYAVDLVGAVHVGEKQYYKALNALFDTYDVVLFELVMAPGTKLPNGKVKTEGGLAGMVKSTLELESQVERVDYTKKHFVHADLSPQEMGEAMRKRGDNGLSVTLSVLGDLIRETNRREQEARKNPKKRAASEIDLFSAMFSSNSALKLKRVMADQMEESADAGAFGPTLGTILIDDRNAAAVKVLDREIKKGHKKIAIYYGAAHLPDFDKRLKRDFGLKPDGIRWIEAWDLTE